MVMALWFSIFAGSIVSYLLAAVFYEVATEDSIPFWSIYILIGFIVIVSLVFLGKILCAKSGGKD